MSAPMGMLHAMSHHGGRVPPVSAETRRRVWAFAHPYRSMVAGFVATVVLSSVLGVVPPLLFREIIDGAIADGDRSRITVLGGLVVVAALAHALLSFLERWWSAIIGEGVIFDLRVALFDHVQRLPLSFFTRTQTGALVSRLNNDVIGAQRALTGTLGTVVANTITGITTVATMFFLEWRITLLSLILIPLFVLPARRVGRIVADITREGMNLNASMNTTMTERFNVSGALLVKLFGRPDEERYDFADQAGRVRDIGIRSALYSRTFLIALTLLGAVGTAAVYWVGGTMAIEQTISIGTLASMGVLVAQLYGPLAQLTNARVDVLSAFVSFERVFEVLDARNPVADAPDALPLDRIDGHLEQGFAVHEDDFPDRSRIADADLRQGVERHDAAVIQRYRANLAALRVETLRPPPVGGGQTRYAQHRHSDARRQQRASRDHRLFGDGSACQGRRLSGMNRYGAGAGERAQATWVLSRPGVEFPLMRR